MNTLPSRYKLCHFNLTTYVSTLPGETKNIAEMADRLYNTVVRFVEPIVLNFRRKSFNVYFPVPCLLENYLAVFRQKIFYILVNFIKNVPSNSIWLILACKLKLNCRDLRSITVMTSPSNYVSKLHMIVKCLFLSLIHI